VPQGPAHIRIYMLITKLNSLLNVPIKCNTNKTNIKKKQSDVKIINSVIVNNKFLDMHVEVAINNQVLFEFGNRNLSLGMHPRILNTASKRNNKLSVNNRSLQKIKHFLCIK
jgi:hypothetical protein